MYKKLTVFILVIQLFLSPVYLQEYKTFEEGIINYYPLKGNFKNVVNPSNEVVDKIGNLTFTEDINGNKESALNFADEDNTVSYVQLPNNLMGGTANPFTIAFRVQQKRYPQIGSSIYNACFFSLATAEVDNYCLVCDWAFYFEQQTQKMFETKKDPRFEQYWNHVAVVSTGTQISVYVNGTLEDEGPSIYQSNASEAAAIILGNDQDNNPLGGIGKYNQLNGKLYDFKAYNVVKSAEQLTEIMNNQCHLRCESCLKQNTNTNDCDACFDDTRDFAQDCACKPEYYEKNTPSCGSCPDAENKKVNEARDECVCKTGYYTIGSTFNCDGQCSSRCVNCVDNSDKCTECNASQNRELLPGNNICTCKLGFFDVSGQDACSECNSSCKTCENTRDNCLECREEQFRELNAETNTCDCKEGYLENPQTENKICLTAEQIEELNQEPEPQPEPPAIVKEKEEVPEEEDDGLSTGAIAGIITGGSIGLGGIIGIIIRICKKTPKPSAAKVEPFKMETGGDQDIHTENRKLDIESTSNREIVSANENQQTSTFSPDQ